MQLVCTGGLSSLRGQELPIFLLLHKKAASWMGPQPKIPVQILEILAGKDIQDTLLPLRNSFSESQIGQCLEMHPTSSSELIAYPGFLNS